jgi:hypothetical protein
MDYFEKRPLGWRDDDRIFKLMQAWGVKEKPYNIFPALRPIYHRPAAVVDNKLDINRFKGSQMFNKLLKAKNGDSLDIW